MKSSRPFTRVQQEREYRESDTDIDVGATRADNDILTREDVEFKEMAKELETEVRDPKEAPPIYSGNLGCSYDDKFFSSSPVTYTEFRAPNSPPPTTISETKAQLFARYHDDSGWFEWTSTRFEDAEGAEDSKVVVHPVWEGVLGIAKDVVGWVRRWWLRAKGRVRMLKTPQGLVQGVINSRRKPAQGQSQSQSQAPPTFSQPLSSSSSFPSISQPSSPAVSRIRSQAQPSINLSQALPISVPKPFSTFTIKPPRPLTKAQQARQHQIGEAGIDADATKAENEILTKENRELKKRVKELEVEVRELKEDLAAQRKKRRKRKREEEETTRHVQQDEPMPMPMSIPSPPPSAHPDADRSASPLRSPSRLPTPVSAFPVQSHRSTPASPTSTKRKRAEPEPEAETPTPSPISPSAVRSTPPSLPTPRIESASAPIPPQVDQSSILPTRDALSKRKQVDPDPTPSAPRVKDVLANLKFTKRKVPPPPSASKRPDPEPTPEAPIPPPTSAPTTIHPSRGTGITQEPRTASSPLAPPRLTKRKRVPGTFEPGSDLPNVTQASSKRRRVPGTFEAGSVPLPPPPPPHPPVPSIKRKDVVGASGPPLDRLFTPTPGGEDHRGRGDSVMKKRRVSELQEEDGEEEQSVKKLASTSHGKPTKSAALIPLRQPSSSVTTATPAPAPVEGPSLDRIFTPTPEPEPEVAPVHEVQKSVRSGVMTMKPTSTSTPTAGGKSKLQPPKAMKPAVRAIPTPSSSSSSLPPPSRVGKQSEPKPKPSISSSATGTTGVEKSKPAVPVPPPSSSVVKVRQEVSASLSISLTSSNNTDNAVIDLTFLDSDEEDQEPPKKKEREVIILSDSDDDDEDEVQEVPRVSVKLEEGSRLDYGTGTSRSHSRSEEVRMDVDAGRGGESEGGKEGGMDVDIDVDLPDTNDNEEEEMQPEPSRSTPQMDVDVDHETETNPPPPHNDTLPPLPSPPIKPDTPTSWDLHHIPPPHLLPSLISIFYHLGKKNRLYCRKCAEERTHRNLWKKFNVGESTWGMLRHVEKEHTSWYERVCGMGEEVVGGVVEGLKGGGV
ncbi:hypothetical protein PQX77_022325 [Marasmius sp. AFHP31]|nr:hypothetical protein PQX77_022325 [Marasmius sp. AFHP31]